MLHRDHDKERGRLSSEVKQKRKNLWVMKLTLKAILISGPWIARAVRLVLDFVGLLKE